MTERLEFPYGQTPETIACICGGEYRQKRVEPQPIADQIKVEWLCSKCGRVTYSFVDLWNT